MAGIPEMVPFQVDKTLRYAGSAVHRNTKTIGSIPSHSPLGKRRHDSRSRTDVSCRLTKTRLPFRTENLQSDVTQRCLGG
ncbi:unnamed protein product [Nezara viridula]|uniref:Uncharacterized protein n=1 Tax=Nezara viridula TaxID=85310 RepID=A0A9P0H177_NEZVI|nr:unnamed protein product [Nezara viridula]